MADSKSDWAEESESLVTDDPSDNVPHWASTSLKTKVSSNTENSASTSSRPTAGGGPVTRSDPLRYKNRNDPKHKADDERESYMSWRTLLGALKRSRALVGGGTEEEKWQRYNTVDKCVNQALEIQRRDIDEATGDSRLTELASEVFTEGLWLVVDVETLEVTASNDYTYDSDSTLVSVVTTKMTTKVKSSDGILHEYTINHVSCSNARIKYIAGPKKGSYDANVDLNRVTVRISFEDAIKLSLMTGTAVRIPAATKRSMATFIKDELKNCTTQITQPSAPLLRAHKEYARNNADGIKQDTDEEAEKLVLEKVTIKPGEAVEEEVITVGSLRKVRQSRTDLELTKEIEKIDALASSRRKVGFGLRADSEEAKKDSDSDESDTSDESEDEDAEQEGSSRSTPERDSKRLSKLSADERALLNLREPVRKDLPTASSFTESLKKRHVKRKSKTAHLSEEEKKRTGLRSRLSRRTLEYSRKVVSYNLGAMLSSSDTETDFIIDVREVLKENVYKRPGMKIGTIVDSRVFKIILSTNMCAEPIKELCYLGLTPADMFEKFWDTTIVNLLRSRYSSFRPSKEGEQPLYEMEALMGVNNSYTSFQDKCLNESIATLGVNRCYTSTVPRLSKKEASDLMTNIMSGQKGRESVALFKKKLKKDWSEVYSASAISDSNLSELSEMCKKTLSNFAANSIGHLIHRFQEATKLKVPKEENPFAFMSRALRNNDEAAVRLLSYQLQEISIRLGEVTSPGFSQCLDDLEHILELFEGSEMRAVSELEKVVVDMKLSNTQDGFYEKLNDFQGILGELCVCRLKGLEYTPNSEKKTLHEFIVDNYDTLSEVKAVAVSKAEFCTGKSAVHSLFERCPDAMFIKNNQINIVEIGVVSSSNRKAKIEISKVKWFEALDQSWVRTNLVNYVVTRANVVRLLETGIKSLNGLRSGSKKEEPFLVDRDGKSEVETLSWKDLPNLGSTIEVKITALGRLKSAMESFSNARARVEEFSVVRTSRMNETFHDSTEKFKDDVPHRVTRINIDEDNMKRKIYEICNEKIVSWKDAKQVPAYAQKGFESHIMKPHMPRTHECAEAIFDAAEEIILDARAGLMPESMNDFGLKCNRTYNRVSSSEMAKKASENFFKAQKEEVTYEIDVDREFCHRKQTACMSEVSGLTELADECDCSDDMKRLSSALTKLISTVDSGTVSRMNDLGKLIDYACKLILSLLFRFEDQYHFVTRFATLRKVPKYSDSVEDLLIEIKDVCHQRIGKVARKLNFESELQLDTVSFFKHMAGKDDRFRMLESMTELLMSVRTSSMEEKIPEEYAAHNASKEVQFCKALRSKFCWHSRLFVLTDTFKEMNKKLRKPHEMTLTDYIRKKEDNVRKNLLRTGKEPIGVPETIKLMDENEKLDSEVKEKLIQDILKQFTESSTKVSSDVAEEVKRLALNIFEKCIRSKCSDELLCNYWISNCLIQIFPTIEGKACLKVKTFLTNRWEAWIYKRQSYKAELSVCFRRVPGFCKKKTEVGCDSDERSEYLGPKTSRVFYIRSEDHLTGMNTLNYCVSWVQMCLTEAKLARPEDPSCLDYSEEEELKAIGVVERLINVINTNFYLHEDLESCEKMLKAYEMWYNKQSDKQKVAVTVALSVGLIAKQIHENSKNLNSSTQACRFIIWGLTSTFFCYDEFMPKLVSIVRGEMSQSVYALNVAVCYRMMSCKPDYYKFITSKASFMTECLKTARSAYTPFYGCENVSGALNSTYICHYYSRFKADYGRTPGELSWHSMFEPDKNQFPYRKALKGVICDACSSNFCKETGRIPFSKLCEACKPEVQLCEALNSIVLVTTDTKEECRTWIKSGLSFATTVMSKTCITVPLAARITQQIRADHIGKDERLAILSEFNKVYSITEYSNTTKTLLKGADTYNSAKIFFSYLQERANKTQNSFMSRGYSAEESRKNFEDRDKILDLITNSDVVDLINSLALKNKNESNKYSKESNLRGEEEELKKTVFGYNSLHELIKGARDEVLTNTKHKSDAEKLRASKIACLAEVKRLDRNASGEEISELTAELGRKKRFKTATMREHHAANLIDHLIASSDEHPHWKSLNGITKAPTIKFKDMSEEASRIECAKYERQCEALMDKIAVLKSQRVLFSEANSRAEVNELVDEIMDFNSAYSAEILTYFKDALRRTRKFDLGWILPNNIATSMTMTSECQHYCERAMASEGYERLSVGHIWATNVILKQFGYREELSQSLEDNPNRRSLYEKLRVLDVARNEKECLVNCVVSMSHARLDPVSMHRKLGLRTKNPCSVSTDREVILFAIFDVMEMRGTSAVKVAEALLNSDKKLAKVATAEKAQFGGERELVILLVFFLICIGVAERVARLYSEKSQYDMMHHKEAKTAILREAYEEMMSTNSESQNLSLISDDCQGWGPSQSVLLHCSNLYSLIGDIDYGLYKMSASALMEMRRKRVYISSQMMQKIMKQLADRNVRIVEKGIRGEDLSVYKYKLVKSEKGVSDRQIPVTVDASELQLPEGARVVLDCLLRGKDYMVAAMHMCQGIPHKNSSSDKECQAHLNMLYCERLKQRYNGLKIGYKEQVSSDDGATILKTEMDEETAKTIIEDNPDSAVLKHVKSLPAKFIKYWLGQGIRKLAGEIVSEIHQSVCTVTQLCRSVRRSQKSIMSPVQLEVYSSWSTIKGYGYPTVKSTTACISSTTGTTVIEENVSTYALVQDVGQKGGDMLTCIMSQSLRALRTFSCMPQIAKRFFKEDTGLTAFHSLYRDFRMSNLINDAATSFQQKTKEILENLKEKCLKKVHETSESGATSTDLDISEVEDVSPGELLTAGMKVSGMSDVKVDGLYELTTVDKGSMIWGNQFKSEPPKKFCRGLARLTEVREKFKSDKVKEQQLLEFLYSSTDPVSSRGAWQKIGAASTSKTIWRNLVHLTPEMTISMLRRGMLSYSLSSSEFLREEGEVSGWKELSRLIEVHRYKPRGKVSDLLDEIDSKIALIDRFSTRNDKLIQQLDICEDEVSPVDFKISSTRIGYAEKVYKERPISPIDSKSTEFICYWVFPDILSKSRLKIDYLTLARDAERVRSLDPYFSKELDKIRSDLKLGDVVSPETLSKLKHIERMLSRNPSIVSEVFIQKKQFSKSNEGKLDIVLSKIITGRVYTIDEIVLVDNKDSYNLSASKIFIQACSYINNLRVPDTLAAELFSASMKELAADVAKDNQELKKDVEAGRIDLLDLAVKECDAISNRRLRKTLRNIRDFLRSGEDSMRPIKTKSKITHSLEVKGNNVISYLEFDGSCAFFCVSKETSGMKIRMISNKSGRNLRELVIVFLGKLERMRDRTFSIKNEREFFDYLYSEGSGKVGLSPDWNLCDMQQSVVTCKNYTYLSGRSSVKASMNLVPSASLSYEVEAIETSMMTKIDTIRCTADGLSFGYSCRGTLLLDSYDELRAALDQVEVSKTGKQKTTPRLREANLWTEVTRVNDSAEVSKGVCTIMESLLKMRSKVPFLERHVSEETKFERCSDIYASHRYGLLTDIYDSERSMFILPELKAEDEDKEFWGSALKSDCGTGPDLHRLIGYLCRSSDDDMSVKSSDASCSRFLAWMRTIDPTLTSEIVSAFSVVRTDLLNLSSRIATSTYYKSKVGNDYSELHTDEGTIFALSVNGRNDRTVSVKPAGDNKRQVIKTISKFCKDNLSKLDKESAAVVRVTKNMAGIPQVIAVTVKSSVKALEMAVMICSLLCRGVSSNVVSSCLAALTCILRPSGIDRVFYERRRAEFDDTLRRPLGAARSFDSQSSFLEEVAEEEEGERAEITNVAYKRAMAISGRIEELYETKDRGTLELLKKLLGDVLEDDGEKSENETSIDDLIGDSFPEDPEDQSSRKSRRREDSKRKDKSEETDDDVGDEVLGEMEAEASRKEREKEDNEILERFFAMEGEATEDDDLEAFMRLASEVTKATKDQFDNEEDY